MVLIVLLIVSFVAIASIVSMVNASMSSNGIIELSNYTNGKRLKVVVEYTNNISSNIENNNSYFRLLFFNPETDRLERHIDYDLVISDKDREIFQLSNELGHPLFPVHSSNGIGMIPIPSNVDKGEITVKVIVDGISFTPIAREEVQFRFVMS